ncbi:histidine phosphatase family protein [Candidatus Puniceispirillum marinum]|uniref:Phosphoglycerate mutase n=1 Tax=Puniceispirillum marinum (strain IMCC1322) TaxID=488538 RepID=D5BQG1_PUNMI|nr:histidine phosphatase family protein [Candidatus Puniceispirillum marinum]ADE40679.1 Phosphoglycerate mutase [Candidatus Puniceispirillum marinum IMCC1322]
MKLTFSALIFIAFIFCASGQVLAATMTIGEYAKAPFGQVLFMRHALAPGTGDPGNFEMSVCATQRNLDDVGRQQARDLGATMASAGISFGAVYSSQWCRCLETAHLLDQGVVTPLPGLNSFYQAIVPRAATLQSLRQFLAGLDNAAVPVLMVTHFVTISAMTGMSVSSGGAVAYDIETGQAVEIIF